jgi:hypothetical protein
MATPDLPQPLPWIFEAAKSSSMDNNRLLKLAREVAMDIRSMDTILEMYDMTPAEWDHISQTPAFLQAVKSAKEEWESASTTAERVRLKSLSFVEEALPEFYARAHDPKEALNAKVEVLKTVARFAGIGAAEFNGSSGSPGDRLTVTINLGQDRQLKIERDVTPQVTIEGDKL